MIDAGPLSATVDGLGLRWVRWHGVELLRGVSFLIRDEHWGTFAPVVEVVARHAGTLHLRGVLERPRLTCDVRIAIAADRLVLDGAVRADEDVTTNRTGFVVLHPETCAGAEIAVEHVTGGTMEGRFPDLISPHQPFFDLRAVTHSPYPGVRVRVTMFGEIFEMEDHRNWSDAGFKTYSRPLAAPRPFVIAAGRTVTQRVEIDVQTTLAPPRLARGAPAVLAGGLPDDAELLLAETRTGRDLDVFARRLQETGRAGAVLLAGEGDRAAEIDALAAACPGIEALLIADATTAAIAQARRALPRARIGAGSAENFTELNRRPPPGGADLVFWGVSATVHAADDASLLETLRVLADQARTARALVGGVPLWVGPIGIGPRWTVDPRDATALGAEFLRGHRDAWALAGVETIIVPGSVPLP